MKHNKHGVMNWLFWAIAFLIVAIIAGVLGLGLIAGVTYTIARWLAIIFAVLFIIAVIQHVIKGRRTNSKRRNTYK